MKKLIHRYRKFLKFDKIVYFKEQVFLKRKRKFSRKFLKRYYSENYRPTFLEFLKDIRDVVYSKNISEVFEKSSFDYTAVFSSISFLREEGLLVISRKGEIKVDEKFRNFFFRPLNKKEILESVREKLRKKIIQDKPLIEILSRNYEWKTEYDQLPINMKTLISTAEKVVKYFPIKNRKILLIGDDDLLSVILSMIGIKSVVVDIDEKLLEILNEIKEEYDLELETKVLDVTKAKRFKKFLIFHTNPPDTLEGMEKFVKFGIKCFYKNLGGFSIFHLGNKNLGNKLLEFQSFLTSNKLKVLEVVNPLAIFPLQRIWEKKESLLKEVESEINLSRYLSTSLWVTSYIPWNIKTAKRIGFMTYL